MPFYTPPKDRSFEVTEPNYIVPVIASFSVNGGVQPLYFQFDDKTIKVTSVHWCEKKIDAFHYECTASLDNYLTEVNLTFYPKDNRWIMNTK